MCVRNEASLFNILHDSCSESIPKREPAPIAPWLYHRVMDREVLGSHLGTNSNPECVLLSHWVDAELIPALLSDYHLTSNKTY